MKRPAIKLKTNQRSSIRHDRLSQLQLKRIARLHQIFSEVEASSLKKWVSNFRRDLHPERELAVWEQMADAYLAYCCKGNLSHQAKRDVFRTVLVRANTRNDKEGLSYLDLKTLTAEDAKKVMRVLRGRGL